MLLGLERESLEPGLPQTRHHQQCATIRDRNLEGRRGWVQPQRL
jgi:hypothetical protein